MLTFSVLVIAPESLSRGGEEEKLALDRFNGNNKGSVTDAEKAQTSLALSD